ncbi:hypothetical protein Poli38472_000049 [Pythium oligandrum]|uniref:EF-hand domain-containing protein n=1 Tax=Pythium oligandrum TaxID=41045 RepID=A0A8K1CB92_PYTOL|nr:hypothetical protein Poli38472_000049 [Pythium oligandrum]|eukprot:TMW60007.1 hypothetical protein Poli38472_000049 [Pythium oligandrum]
MPSTIPEDSKLSSNIRQTSFRATSVLDDDEDEPPLTLLGKCWQFFDDPNSSTPAYYFSLTLFFFIILSTVVFVAQTEDALSPYTNVLGTIETICAIVFTAELGMRLLFAPSKWQFAKYYGNWIDFAAILPYYLEAVLKVENAGSFGAIRIVRLTRVARVLKISRYSSAIQVFVQAISISIKALSMLLFLMSIAMIVFSSAIYFAEYTPDGCRKGGWIGQCAPVSTGSGMNGTLASTVAAAAAMTAMNTQNCICVDPNPYKSIASSFWWCIVTMSTVGYGDMTPVTLPGKIIGCATVLTGMLVLALPITVIGTNFQKVMKSVVQQTMKTNVDYLKGKRQICREEIQAILQRFHAVTEDIHLDIEDIINVYDTDNSGTLEDEELARFRHDLEMLQNRAFMNQHLPSAVELRGAAVVPTSAVRASVSSASPFDPYVSIDPSCDGVSGVESLVETDKRHKSLSRVPTNSGLGPSMAASDVRASRASTSRPSDGSSPSVESVVHSFHASPPPSRSSSPVGRVHSMSRRSSDMRPVDDDLLCVRLLEMQRMWEERLLETETRLEAKLLNLNKIMLRIESMMEQED